MNPNEYDDWKASFKYELKCCGFGFLYGFIASIAFIFLFSRYNDVIVPLCAIAIFGLIILNIIKVKFSIKAILIELPIALGSFFTVLILWALTDPKPIIFID